MLYISDMGMREVFPVMFAQGLAAALSPFPHLSPKHEVGLD